MSYPSRLSDEDAAFAAAQWASGITQKAIAAHFGWSHASNICSAIEAFIRKYTDVSLDYERCNGPRVSAVVGDRRMLVKTALANFVATRAAPTRGG